MPLMIRLNRVMQVPDGEIEQYRANGYKLYEPAVAVGETEPEQSPAPASPESPDYSDMEDSEIAELAALRGIDTEGKTKRQVINLLKKEV